MFCEAKELSLAEEFILGGSMQAEVQAHGEILVVSLKGRVDLECMDAFKMACNSRFTTGKIVFDLKHLSFVGSTGLTVFIETLSAIVEITPLEPPRFVGLSPEFRRLFSSGKLKMAKVYSDLAVAFNSFYFEPEDPGFL